MTITPPIVTLIPGFASSGSGFVLIRPAGGFLTTFSLTEGLQIRVGS